MANFISSTQHDHVLHKYDAIACFELKWGRRSFKPFEHKGKKTLTAYKVHFQCQESGNGTVPCQSALWEFIYTPNFWQHW